MNTIKELTLFPLSLIHIYRNCMINMDYVQQMDDHDFLMKDQVQIPINRARKSEIRQAYADYSFKRLSEG